MEIFKSFSRNLLIGLFLSASFNLSAQVLEDFSDKDLLKSPPWTGNLGDFRTNDDLELQLNASEAGISYIVTPSSVYDNASWELFFRLGFNPSSQNYAKIYLISDSENLSGAINGYFVLIEGGDDAISLYREENGVATQIIEGENGRLNSNGVSGKIKISRTMGGKWELWTAIPSESAYLKEGETTDSRTLASSYFGIYCEYTSTRSDKFYFDDIIVSGTAFQDGIPPELLSIEATAPNQLVAKFSEPISSAFGFELANFNVQPQMGHPQKVELKDNPSELELYFEKNFTSGAEYLFTAINVADTAQNISPPLSLPFLYFIPTRAAYRDVVINEMMPDPTPVVGLPEAEFIEIFNRSDKVFDLSGWTIGDNTSLGSLAPGSIMPGEHVILCSASDSLAFAEYGKTITVSGFPSLNNDGDDLYLRNSSDDLIDNVHYTNAWYRSSIRSAGGYSLEMIDYSNPCSGGDNWGASEHHDGGTPGQVNSIQGSKPDNSAPVLENVYPASDSLILTFNEILDPTSVETGQYFLNDKRLTTEAYLNNNGVEVILKLSEPLDVQIKYTLVAKNIKDCNGNFIDDEGNSRSFSLPMLADSVDIIINEVLFNPNTGGADFVEIYNNSEKYINLKGWMLANTAIEKESGKSLIANRTAILDYNHLFAPREFIVLTTDIADIHKHYPRSVGGKIIPMSSFPSFPDVEGTVVLLSEKNEVIDRFDYHEDYHSPIISESDGVSLERIAYDAPTQDAHNWTSAASTAGFASPGAANSQSMHLSELQGTITVHPQVIIPDNDGSRDFTTIQYTFENNSYIGNVYVFDINGNRVSTIAENESFAKEGFFTWEGTRENGGILGLGVYMIFFEVFDFDGTVKVFKAPVAIGSDF